MPRKPVERRTHSTIAAILAGIGLLLLTLSASAHAPHNIGLTRFEARVEGNAVRLEWEVATEIGTAGYKLKRGQSGTFAFLQAPGGGDLFINAEGGAALGATYDHTDTAVVAGETYAYQLVEVTTASQEVVQDEVTITFAVTATETPIVLPTLDPGGDSNQNPAATATQSAPTATAQPSLSNTPLPPTVAAPVSGPTVTASAPTAVPTAAANEPAPPAPVQAAPEEQSGYPGAAEAVVIEDENIALDEVEEAAFAANVAQAQEAQPGEVGYPGPETALTDATGAAAPVAEQAAPVVISGAAGTEAAPAAAPVSAAQENGGEEGGLTFLWIAFLAALTIFVAAVIGAIILYTRRQSG